MDYIVERVEEQDELMHYGVLGMKWGVRRNRSTGVKQKKKKLTYREQVENDMRAYDKQHPERRRNDNYTIALRNEARRQNDELLRRQLASMALLPVGGLGFATAAGNIYVAQKRTNTLNEIMDEYNIQEAKRVLNM